MGIDGMFLHQLRHELAQVLTDSRVDRIHQPGKELLIFSLRSRAGGMKLLLHAGASSPRAHITKMVPENPKQPPMFCMLLRKHLGSAKLVELSQTGMDRILQFRFEAVNELGDLVELVLAVEIMGRHSNIVLIDQNGKIIDAIKRVDFETSSVRQILPDMQYQLPPEQAGKVNLLQADPAEIARQILQAGQKEIASALLANVSGMSPLVCREAENYTTHGIDLLAGEMKPEQLGRLTDFLGMLKLRLEQYSGIPTLLLDGQNHPKDFSFLPIHQYRGAYKSEEMQSYSEMLDRFYAERDLNDRMRQRSSDLLRLLANTTDRIRRKGLAQREELELCKDRDRWKMYGDLISSNLYRLEKGQTLLRTENYYDPDGAEISIPLDPALSPAANAQKYYHEYRKLDTAEKKLQQIIIENEKEIEYLDSVFDALARATTLAEIVEIRKELAQAGYGKRTKPERQKPEKLSPMRFRSSDGFEILVGRNNLQNDQLTLKDARNYDIWFHTQKIPGSHTVVLAGGKTVPNQTLEEAAIIAAYHSKAKDSALVPVDYTEVKNVKKPPGAKPGMVIYDKFRTAIVTPDADLISRLEQK